MEGGEVEGGEVEGGEVEGGEGRGAMLYSKKMNNYCGQV